MSRASTNANVIHRPESGAVEAFRDAIHGAVKRRCGSVAAFADMYGMTAPAIYDRLKDPDRFTMGQIREARMVLGLTKAEMVEMVRCLL